MKPSARLLADNKRLHLQHGPIDLIIEAFADDASEIERAYRQAWLRFQDVLQPLVDELPLLRRPLAEVYPLFRGEIARSMAAAVWPHRQLYITPMAAVAGAVADHVLAALIEGRHLRKAYVNNGGDIALHLTPGEDFAAGIVDDQDRPAIDAVARIGFADPVRGIATSGWRGRSHSLGIADAVSVLAENAAAADAAATMVANAVDIQHPAIRRQPARQLREDSDLGDLPVTVDVGPLEPASVARALQNGLRKALALRQAGLLREAYLSLQGQTLTTAAAGIATRTSNG